MTYLNKPLLVLLSFSLLLFVNCKDAKVDEPSVVDSDTAFTKTIEFNSLDDLLITADHYHIKNTAPVIVLCHQAGYSRGEYLEIAPKLNALGFNCIAIDQRSGGSVNGVLNETNKRAKAESKGTTYNDAKQDLTAAVAWAKKTYNKNVILWGSSYSSSLALIVAKENSDVEQVLSFSPGEYLNGVSVKTSITGLDKPAFLSSAKNEQSQTKALFDVISSDKKTQFIPNGAGRHGSSCLWKSEADNGEYWVAVKTFLGV
ncbi:MAG: alpha/beta hydrolase [Bacteroidia bacterium]